MILARFTKIIRMADIELSADGRTEEWKDGKRTAQLHTYGRTATEVRRGEVRQSPFAGRSVFF